MTRTPIPFEQILQRAQHYKADMTRFLRDMIAIPSESADEEKVVLRIKQEMEKVGFDRTEIDPMGNLLGYIGRGPRLIAMDAHIDTVGVGNLKNWTFDPYQGMEDDEIIGGRGGSDQEGGMASMVYAGKIIKDLGLTDAYTLLVTGTVQEEDCDGLCWLHLIQEEKIRPELVVITEPTNMNIYRGHRGRMEIHVSVKGVSCHGSAPERGVNAIYKASKIALEIEKLNDRLRNDPFLGKGTVTVTEIVSSSPSLCAVADSARLHLDRRLTAGETRESAIAEVQDAAARAGITDAIVQPLTYNEAAYTGKVYPMEKYYPTWTMPEDSPYLKGAVAAYTATFGKAPVVDKWTFSTNGIAVAGIHNIPCLGLGPGNEVHAHAPNEATPIEHLTGAAAFYASLVETLARSAKP